jgi:hypothetical protein
MTTDYPASESLAPALRTWIEPDVEGGFNVMIESLEDGGQFRFLLPPQLHYVPNRLAATLATQVAEQLQDFAGWLFDLTEGIDDDAAYSKLFTGPQGPIAPDHESRILAIEELEESVGEDGETEAGQAEQEQSLAAMGLSDLRQWLEQHPNREKPKL